MMLITGALILRREHTKLCILHFCREHRKKRILEGEKKEKALHDSSGSASVYISVLLHRFSKVMNCRSFAASAIFKTDTPPPTTAPGSTYSAL